MYAYYPAVMMQYNEYKFHICQRINPKKPILSKLSLVLMITKFIYLYSILFFVQSKNHFIDETDRQKMVFAEETASIICKFKAKNVQVYFEEKISIEFITAILINISPQCDPPKIMLTR